MMRALALCLIAAPPAPALADAWCEDIWIARNAFFARAGHCFGSVLGREVFGNAGCTGSLPTLAAEDAEAVAHLQRLEQDMGCAVPTDRPPSARLRERAARLARLRDIPVPDEYGWACHGYRGPGMVLRSGASDTAPEIGRAGPGTVIGSDHQWRGKWLYVTVKTEPGGPILADGWTRDTVRPGACEHEAG
jgi:hypothetical protein